MRIGARAFLGPLFLASGIACSNTSIDPVDHNSPPTFQYPCEGDASICQSPFTCMRSPGHLEDGGACGTLPFCTSACSSDNDCPHWLATGRCGGPFQAVCRCGACVYPAGCQ